MTFQELWQPLKNEYGEREARAVTRWLLDVVFHINMTDIIGGAIQQLTPAQQQQLLDMQQQLLQGIPVQYVAGIADFGPRQFIVAPGVLIPRPETYELCQWIISDHKTPDTTGAEENPQPPTRNPKLRNTLDIGTGSGCIACTLAAELPGASVTACDISPLALRIARQNARWHQLNIQFLQRDILQAPTGNDEGKWDIIVSNPPYICNQEAQQMDAHVLEHEPKIALFVPDDNPMLFYLPISKYAQTALKEKGQLYLEINPQYHKPIEDILRRHGFHDITIRQDQYGKNRMIRATWH